jgi:very-short-patch-repair endonuclease
MREDEHRSRPFAVKLRQRLTDAEMIVWSRLRTRRDGYRFRRQHPIGPYIADFACVRARLVIEIDGMTHCSDAERAYDARRDAFMQTKGWNVVRFTNDDVYERLDHVLEGIFLRLPTPRGLSRR